MVKIALLDFDDLVTEIQEVNDVDNIIQALKLGEEDYVILTSQEVPVTSGRISEAIKYNRNLDTFEIVEVEVIADPNEPTNAQVAQMISDLQADLVIAGVI